MTRSRKILGHGTAAVAALVAGIATAGTLLGAVSYVIGGDERFARLFRSGLGQDVTVADWAALIVGMVFGAGAGIYLWSWFVVRMGWFTSEETLCIIKHPRHRGGRRS
jgi:hypothetical protein